MTFFANIKHWSLSTVKNTELSHIQDEIKITGVQHILTFRDIKTTDRDIRDYPCLAMVISSLSNKH